MNMNIPLVVHNAESLQSAAMMNAVLGHDLYVILIVYLLSRLDRIVYSYRSTIIKRTMYYDQRPAELPKFILEHIGTLLLRTRTISG